MAENYCQEHDTVFFKKGKMPGYAHPLEGGGWCNMDEDTGNTPPAELKGKTILPDTFDPANKGYALRYATDLAVAGVINRDEIISFAKAFEGFMNGILIIKDDDIFRIALTHCRIKGKEED